MPWPLPRQLRKADRLWLRFREQVARRLGPTSSRTLRLQSPAGHELPARLHLPSGPGPWPGVLLVPGVFNGAATTESPQCVLPAQRLARAGFAVLVFTPSGREDAAGPPDCNGPLHQAECGEALAALLAAPEVAPGGVQVLTLSFGLVMALGALRARPELAAKVRWLHDWEGPGHRRWFAAARIGAEPSDDAFWEPREGVRLIRDLAVRYRRFQSRWDHVHGPDPSIGREMAEAGWSAGLPAVFLNEHQAPLPGPEGVTWGPGLRSRQGVILLQWLIHGREDGRVEPSG